jgi:hypothetical protein
LRVSWTKRQDGSATAIALMTMVILASLAAAYVTASSGGLSRLTGFSYGENLQAKAAAEAGIRYAWMHALENATTTNVNGVAVQSWDPDLLPGGEIQLDSANANSPAFTLAATLLTTNLPAGLPADKYNYYRITATGHAGASSAVLNAYLEIPIHPADPTLIDMIDNATYSDNIKWPVDRKGTPNDYSDDTATAPGTSAYYQALFNQKVYPQTGFNLNYRINLNSTTPGYPGATGYGIYYMATDKDNANNISAYVLQYDPGLEPDQIVVKKVAQKPGTTVPSNNEIKSSVKVTAYESAGYNYTNGSGNQSWQATNAAASWNNASWKLKVEEQNSDPYYTQDIMTVPINMVLNTLNKLKANGTNNNKMLGQDHIMTIDLRPVTLPDGTRRMVHRIYMDGLEILRFVDRSSSNNYANLAEGYTGLRVWNATTTFQNMPSSGTRAPIIIHSWDIQKP